MTVCTEDLWFAWEWTVTANLCFLRGAEVQLLEEAVHCERGQLPHGRAAEFQQQPHPGIPGPRQLHRPAGKGASAAAGFAVRDQDFTDRGQRCPFAAMSNSSLFH